MRNGDSVNLVPSELGSLEGLFNNWSHGLDMGTSGDFRDDSTVDFVDVNLGIDDVAQNIGAILDDGAGGFVATGFDSQDIHRDIIQGK